MGELLKDIPTSQITRFVIVGLINTIFGFCSYALLAFLPIPTWLVLILSNIIGIAFNFFTTGGIVFNDIRLSRLPRFLISYGIIFLIYLELIRIISPIVGGRISAMAVIVIPMAALTYIIQVLFVFERDQ